MRASRSDTRAASQGRRAYVESIPSLTVVDFALLGNLSQAPVHSSKFRMSLATFTTATLHEVCVLLTEDQQPFLIAIVLACAVCAALLSAVPAHVPVVSLSSQLLVAMHVLPIITIFG